MKQVIDAFVLKHFPDAKNADDYGLIVKNPC